MAEGGVPQKTPKSTFKHLHELVQKNSLQINENCKIEDGQFVCTLDITSEQLLAGSHQYTGKGGNKTTAREIASAEALAVLEVKFRVYKEDKNPVSKLNELCQKLQLKAEFVEKGKSGNEFECRLRITVEKNEEKRNEDYRGKGRSKKDAKNNAASVALEESELFRTDSEVLDDDDVVGLKYARSLKQTGYVLIINFKTGREWVDADEDNIRKFFKDELNFQCTIQGDSTKDELLKKLDETASELNQNGENYYCFVLFLMGHGNQFGVRTADKDRKRTISTDEILDYFKNEKLPNFVGKPKAFFIQSCRGSEHQETYQQADDIDENAIIRVPRDGDIFIAHATTEGYKAYRMRHVGAIFIHNTISIFERFYKNKHLEEMMIDVKATVALKPDWRKKNTTLAQMPCTWSTLTKRLQFYKKEAN